MTSVPFFPHSRGRGPVTQVAREEGFVDLCVGVWVRCETVRRESDYGNDDGVTPNGSRESFVGMFPFRVVMVIVRMRVARRQTTLRNESRAGGGAQLALTERGRADETEVHR